MVDDEIAHVAFKIYFPVHDVIDGLMQFVFMICFWEKAMQTRLDRFDLQFIPVGDANRNYATATRLKIRISCYPTVLDSLRESATAKMKWYGSLAAKMK